MVLRCATHVFRGTSGKIRTKRNGWSHQGATWPSPSSCPIGTGNDLCLFPGRRARQATHVETGIVSPTCRFQMLKTCRGWPSAAYPSLPTSICSLCGFSHYPWTNCILVQGLSHASFAGFETAMGGRTCTQACCSVRFSATCNRQRGSHLGIAVGFDPCRYPSHLLWERRSGTHQSPRSSLRLPMK